MQGNIVATDTRLPIAVQRFLEGVQTGNWEGIADYYTDDVFYDATIPGWRYQYQGIDQVVHELRHEWTRKHPWRIVEMHVAHTEDGIVVDFEVRGRCPGDRHHGPHEEACRLANIFRLENGRIAEHRFYCAGEWDEETIRRIEAEAPLIRHVPL